MTAPESSARVTITGRLGRDPEIRHTPNGAKNVSFSIPVDRKWRDRDGNDRTQCTWFRVTAWRELAERLDALANAGELMKGKLVRVTGSIELREYTNREGLPKCSLDVLAFEIAINGQVVEMPAREPVPVEAQQLDLSDVPF